MSSYGSAAVLSRAWLPNRSRARHLVSSLTTAFLPRKRKINRPGWPCWAGNSQRRSSPYRILKALASICPHLGQLKTRLSYPGSSGIDLRQHHRRCAFWAVHMYRTNGHCFSCVTMAVSAVRVALPMQLVSRSPQDQVGRASHLRFRRAKLK
jgi:hypothetical protein